MLKTLDKGKVASLWPGTPDPIPWVIFLHGNWTRKIHLQDFALLRGLSHCTLLFELQFQEIEPQGTFIWA